ncbi:lysine--tRNA ligase [bacterium]|nr:lysine--tRNA ligase [bacterium]
MTENNSQASDNETVSLQEENDQRQMRSEHLAALYAAHRNPYGKAFERTCPIADIAEKYGYLQPGEEKADDIISLAGRISSRRGHGKIMFMDLLDRSGRIQLYFKINTLGEDNYKMLELLDLIDMVTVTGYPFRTKRGELSLHVTAWDIAAKALQPPPAKFHGLKDVEVRYRQRYADLLSNADVRDVFIKRSRIISSIRRFLDGQGYLEVETPTLSTVAGGAAARPFITFHNALNTEMYLRIATELHLKRCIVGGLEKVYEIGRIFRNEGIDTTHNPEFTTIELYEAWSDYEGMMRITEGIIDNACKEVLGTHTVCLNGTEINLKPPYARRTMDSLLQEYAHISIAELRQPGRAREKAEELGVKLGDREFTLAHYIDKVFEAACEEHLVQPTFVIDYPIELSPLAKQREDDPSMTYRFELFVNCSELANAFSELNDPREQLKRFEAQQAQRDLDDEAHPIDMDFIRALEYGMPPTGGMGMGIDRLVMLLTAQDSIRDVLLFPTMKTVKNEGK